MFICSRAPSKTSRRSPIGPLSSSVLHRDRFKHCRFHPGQTIVGQSPSADGVVCRSNMGMASDSTHAAPADSTATHSENVAGTNGAVAKQEAELVTRGSESFERDAGDVNGPAAASLSDSDMGAAYKNECGETGTYSRNDSQPSTSGRSAEGSLGATGGGNADKSNQRSTQRVRSLELRSRVPEQDSVQADRLLEAGRRLAGLVRQSPAAVTTSGWSRPPDSSKAQASSLSSGEGESDGLSMGVGSEPCHREENGVLTSKHLGCNERQGRGQKWINPAVNEARRKREREWLELIRSAGRLPEEGGKRASVVLLLLELMQQSRGVYKAVVSVHHISAAVTVCARGGEFEAAQRVVELGRRWGGRAAPNAYVYSALAGALCQAGRGEEARQLLLRMDQEGVLADVVLFNVLLEGAETAQAGDLLWRDMQQRGIVPNERSFSAMLRCLGRSGDSAAALEVWEQMRKAGVVPTVFTFNSLLDAYARAGQLGQCWGLLHQMADAKIAPDRATFHTLINAHALQKDVDGALDALQAMHRAGFAPGIVAYNISMEACLRGRQLERVFRLYRTALRASLHPDQTTFSVLLRAAGHLRERNAVEWALAEMARHRCTHDAVTYRCAVFAFVRCGEGGSALDTLTQMMAAGHEPAMDPTTVLVKSVDAALLREVTAAGPAGRLRPFLTDMARAGLSPTPATAGSIVRRLTASHGLLAALEVAEELQAAGIGPLAGETWDALQAALATTAQLQASTAASAGRRLLAAMQADGVTPTGSTYEAAVKACARSGDGAGALVLYEAMQAAGVEGQFSLDSIFLATVDAAITDAIATGESGGNTPAQATDVEDTRLVEDLAAAGIRLKPRAVSKVIKRLTSAKEPALRSQPLPPSASFEEEEPESNQNSEEGLQRALVLMDVLPQLFDVQPTATTYASLMNACIRQGQAGRVEELWVRMVAEGVQPDSEVWQARIRSMAERGLVAGQTRAILALIANDRCTPTPGLLRTLVRCCRQARDWEGAQYVDRLAEAMSRQKDSSDSTDGGQLPQSNSDTDSQSTAMEGQVPKPNRVMPVKARLEGPEAGSNLSNSIEQESEVEGVDKRPDARADTGGGKELQSFVEGDEDDSNGDGDTVFASQANVEPYLLSNQKGGGAAWIGGSAFEWSAQDWGNAVVRGVAARCRRSRSRLSLPGQLLG